MSDRLMSDADYQRYRSCGGCICPLEGEPGSMRRVLDPHCPYHRIAAEFADDHRIPWNCPTYYDGCNCDGTEWWEKKERHPDSA